MNLLTRIENKAKRMLWKPSLAGGQRLIIHLGQHKSMTSYFNTVLFHICVDFDWEFVKVFNESEYQSLVAGKIRQPLEKITVVCCYNHFPDPATIGQPFVGSNIVRDPRDLIVSGYKYHLWTTEWWACRPLYLNRDLWDRLGLDDRFPDIPKEKLGLMSYRELLNSVSKEEGYLLELDFRKKHFDAMNQWTYDVPGILEMKYENVFGNEEQAFRQLFRHYGFSEKMIGHSLKYVRDNSFRKIADKGSVGERSHASTGSTGQWKQTMPESVLSTLMERHKDLLIKLGYLEKA